MKQVGDNVTVGLSAVSAEGTNIYAYAWRLWDGSSTATEVPTLTTCVNIGGQPTDDRLLNYSVVPVDVNGSYVEINGSFQANNPPYIVPSPTLSKNDGYFPYQTDIQVIAYDLENDPMTFAWYQGVVPLGAGTLSFVGTYEGTWRGNGTEVFVPVLAYQNGTSLTVSSARTVTCFIFDSETGTTSLDFQLRGQRRPVPVAGIAATAADLTTDSTSLPVARIGPGQTVQFEVYAKDVTGSDLDFLWGFNLDNNWTIAETLAGTTSPTADGGFRNNVTKDISGEVIAVGTSKVATALCQVSGPVGATVVRFDVTLLKNTAPTSLAVSAFDNDTAITGPVATGTLIEFVAAYADADNDICTFRWVFAQATVPTTLVLYGPRVYLDTTGYASGAVVSGQVVCTDQAGASVTISVPSVAIT